MTPKGKSVMNSRMNLVPELSYQNKVKMFKGRVNRHIEFQLRFAATEVIQDFNALLTPVFLILRGEHDTR